MASLKGRGGVLICGGAVVDCIARPSDGSQRGASQTSMPGEARISLGGVGRNVAESVARLGVPVRLVSAVGADEPGKQLLHHSQELNIGVEGVVQMSQCRTATYTALLDGSGELVGAVADMAIFDSIGPDIISAGCGALADVGLLVCDANLGSPALEAALRSARKAGVPAWFEPVSVAKASRGRLSDPWHLATPNWDELLALLGRAPQSLPAAQAISNGGSLPAEVYAMIADALCCQQPVAQNLLL
ncbi:unnamed protein product, partial [Polarella glacialis]